MASQSLPLYVSSIIRKNENEDCADEIIVVGQDWPDEFSFSYIGEVFQEGLDKSNGDWVIHMDIDNFFHENSISILKEALSKYDNLPTITFPKYQIFTPDRYHIKANMCIALNKKGYPNLKMDGGGDLCQPTLNSELLRPADFPFVNVPIWNYDSVFKTKDVISKDRARFARAWFREFKEWGERGGDSNELAFEAWFNMIEERYAKHIFNLSISDHPVYVQEKIRNLKNSQFGFDAFGLKQTIKKSKLEYLRYFKNKLFH